MLRANSSLEMSRLRDKQQMWEGSWSRIIPKSWGCLHIIFLVICSAVTVRENRHRLMGCVKWAWWALGSSSSPIPISGITSTLIDRPCSLQRLSRATVWALCSCRVWSLSELTGEMLLRQHTELYETTPTAPAVMFLKMCCASWILLWHPSFSAFSPQALILFHHSATFQPEWKQCLFCSVCLVGRGENACDWGKLGSLEGFCLLGQQRALVQASSFDLAKVLQKWTGPSVLVWSSC